MGLSLQKSEKYILMYLAVLLSTYLLRTVSDPDLWWHIVIGRWIVAHGEVPWVDYWNAFAVDKPWLAYSWSFDVACSLIDRYFGIYGLQAAQFLLGVLLSGAILGVLVLLAQSATFGIMCGCIAVCATYPYFFLRPQSISWVLFLFLIFVGERIRSSGVTRKRLFAIFLLMAIWANTNITSVFGLAVVSAWVLVLDHGESEFKESLFTFAQIAVVGFLGSLLTPYHGYEWLMAGNTFYHPWLYSNIVEFGPLTLYNFQAGMLLLELVFLGFLLHYQPRGIPFMQLLMCVGFAVLGVCVTKFCPHAVIVCSSVISISWSKNRAMPQSLGNIGNGIAMLENWVKSLSNKTIFSIGFLLFSASFLNAAQSYKIGNFEFGVTPIFPLNIIQEKKLPLPVVSTFGNGGYLLYRFSGMDGVPAFRVAIDGRTNVNDDEIAKLHTAALGGTSGWDRFISITRPETIVWPNESPLVSLLLLSNDWCKVYQDNEEILLQRPSRLSSDTDIGHSVFVRRSFFEQYRSELKSPDC